MDPVYAPNKTISKTWERTSALRWGQSGVRYFDAATGGAILGRPVLEQEWRCRETNEIDWREIPTVTR
jgi:hypothetical protein